MNALEVRFLSDIELRVHPRPPPGCDPGRCYQLISPLRVQVGASELVEIPAAFYSDGGSIPWYVWSLIRVTPTHPRFVRSFFLHDFLYATNYRGSRRLCDDLLYNGALSDGANALQRELVYLGVRIGGGAAWSGYRDRSRLTLNKDINSITPGEPMYRLTVANWSRNLDGLS